MKTFFFFGEHLRLCPWSLALASSIPVLGLESVCPRKGCPWPWPRIFFVSLALASSLVSSTPPLLLTLVNRCAWNRVVGWHVSNVPSFSDHMYIRFQVKSRIQKQTKMFRNVCRTCWSKHVNKLEQKLNERILRPVGYRCLSQKKELMCWQTRFIQLLLNSMKLLALCKSCLARKIISGGIPN